MPATRCLGAAGLPQHSMRKLPRVAWATLGCKANQFDGFSTMDQLAGRVRWVDFSAPADVYVVNTCTVTHRADADARNLIRRARRANPQARIVVTGCWAQTQPQVVAALEGVTHVVGNSHKHRLAQTIVAAATAPGTAAAPQIEVAPLGFSVQPPLLAPTTGASGGTRAFIKLQDGCDYSCSFCITTVARGRSTSLNPDAVVAQVQAHVARGVHEVVLTGVQIGRYGADLTPRTTLAHVLTRIVSETAIERVRLSSVDPREWDRDLVALMLHEPRLCPHAHIPLQSGDDAILLLMRRGYTAADVRRLIERLRAGRPDMMIGTDVIAGFPGEGPVEFDMTCEFLERYVDYAHVFSYSDRPQTKAAAMADKLPPDVIRHRADVLRSISARKRRAFASRLAGTRQRVLVERSGRRGERLGYTDHYVPVRIPPQMAHTGALVEVVVDLDADGSLVALGN